MTAPIFIDARNVAQLLELPSGPAFLARRATLEADHGFPAPVPWTRSPLKWRREDVIRWRDNLPDTRALADLAPAPRADKARQLVALSMARQA